METKELRPGSVGKGQRGKAGREGHSPISTSEAQVPPNMLSGTRQNGPFLGLLLTARGSLLQLLMTISSPWLDPFTWCYRGLRSLCSFLLGFSFPSWTLLIRCPNHLSKLRVPLAPTPPEVSGSRDPLGS